jgi:alpha-1,3-rhamnosyl/mannosyltransferase
MVANALRVAIGTTVLQHGRASSGIDGIGTYAESLLANLHSSYPDFEITPFSFSGYRRAWWSEKNQLFPFGAGAAISALTQLSHIGARSTFSHVDLVHATDHLIPRVRSCPVVATLMDAIPLSHPEWVRVRFRPIKSALWKKTAQRADHILTISHFSKLEIERWFGIPEARITVIPLGVDESYFNPISPLQLQQVRELLRLPEQFFLVLGTIQPRKNIERILEAHLALPGETRRRVPLLIAGRYGWGAEELRAKLERVQDESCVRWLRYVTETEKRVLLSTASALVFPSLYEGFGLPILEALASGAPLITSNVSAIPEMANRDNALIVDPMHVDALTRAMLDVVTNPTGASARARIGRSLAQQYTWRRCASETVEAYRRII